MVGQEPGSGRLQPGRTVRISVSRGVAYGSIVGRAVFDNVPLSGVTVTLGGASLTTGADGVFRFDGLEAGSYDLDLSASYYGYGWRTDVAVAAGQVTDVGDVALSGDL